MQSCRFLFERGAGIRARVLTAQGSLQVGPGEKPLLPLNLPPPHVFLAWLGLKFARLKIYAERTECSRRLVGKKSEMKIVLFFSCSAETYFRPLPYTFLTSPPPPIAFLPPLPSSGIFQSCLVLAKSTKKAFSEATRPCTRAICLFWDWGRKSCRPESRRLLQGNVSARPVAVAR